MKSEIDTTSDLDTQKLLNPFHTKRTLQKSKGGKILNMVLIVGFHQAIRRLSPWCQNALSSLKNGKASFSVAAKKRKSSLIFVCFINEQISDANESLNPRESLTAKPLTLSTSRYD